MKFNEPTFVTETLGIKVFDSGEILLKEIESGTFFQIIFMDIEMEGMNGVDVVGRIREMPNGDDTLIVFISAHDAYFRQIAYVGAFRFINKPFVDDEVDLVIQRVLLQALKYKAITGLTNVLTYRVNQKEYSININQVVYLKSKKRQVEIYAWDSETEDTKYCDNFYAKLDDLSDKLSSFLFVRCEQSYIVNMLFVERFCDTCFMLCDKKETHIPISRSYREKVKSIYFRHQESHL